MKKALAIAALAAAPFLVSPGAAAPKATGPDECAAFGDMALVARALSAVEVDKEKARAAIPHIYTLSEPRQVEIALAVVEAGYRDARPSREFAGDLMRACMRRGGDMDSVLGTPS